MKLCVTYYMGNFYSASPAISWYHNSSWGMDQAEGEGGRCSYTATLKLFLKMWESPLGVYLQQLQQKRKDGVSDVAGGYWIAWASEVCASWDQWRREVRLLVVACWKFAACIQAQAPDLLPDSQCLLRKQAHFLEHLGFSTRHHLQSSTDLDWPCLACEAKQNCS